MAEGSGPVRRAGTVEEAAGATPAERSASAAPPPRVPPVEAAAQRAGDWGMTHSLVSAMGLGGLEDAGASPSAASGRGGAAGGSGSSVTAAVQARGELATGGGAAAVQAVASAGVAGGGAALPHLGEIQQSFGPHDVSGIRAHVGGAAAEASQAIGAQAYATGNDVAFASTPDLHTAAHEAAHVVQQRGGVQLAGGVGAAGDPYERHADAVADRVVRGESAAELLGAGPGQVSAAAAPAGSAAVQRQGAPENEGYEQPRWIATLRASAKMRSGPAQSNPILLEFAAFDAPLYYRGHWRNDTGGQAYAPGDVTPAFPLRWLEVEFRHPQWPAFVAGWMHSGTTHYPGQILEPDRSVYATLQVSGSAVPATVGNGTGMGTGTGTETGSGTGGPAILDGPPALQEPNLMADVPADKLEVIGGGIDAVYVSDSATPQQILAELPRIQPFVISGQEGGCTFHSSPNLSAVALASRVGPNMAVLGLVRGRLADYPTFEYLHNMPGGTVRRSDLWLVVEYEGGTYFVHAGSTLVSNAQLALALGQEAPAPEGEAGGEGGGALNLDDWTSQGDPLAEVPPAGELDEVGRQQYLTLNGFAPGELVPAGFLPSGMHLVATTAAQAVPLKIAPDAMADHLPPLVGIDVNVTTYGVLPQQGGAWFRVLVRGASPEQEDRYGWMAADRLRDGAALAQSMGAPIVEDAAAAANQQPLPGVGTIHVTRPGGTDALSAPQGGTFVAHLDAGFAIANVYEVVLGQTETRESGGFSNQWLRVGLTRASAAEVVQQAYVSVLDTSFSAPVAATSIGGGSSLQIAVTSPNVYVYSSVGFNRDAQLNTAALDVGHPLAVLWEETSLEGALWLRVRTDTNVGTLEGFVAAGRTSYAGGAPSAPVHEVESTVALAGGGGGDAVITAERARIRPNAAAGPSDTPLGYLTTGARISILLRYDTEDMDGVVETDLGASRAWLFVEIPADQVVLDEVGAPLADPPRRGWIHSSATSAGHTGGEAMSGRPTNEGAAELTMPGAPPSQINVSLTPGMQGPEVEMAKIKLVQLGYMNMTELDVVGRDYYTAWTIEAVKSFQLLGMQRDDDQVDGIISPVVWRALFGNAAAQSHMPLATVESILASAGMPGPYQWDDVVNNPYAYENFGSSDYWGPGVPGGECTWFVRSVLTSLPVRSGSGSWARDLAALISPTPAPGYVMNQGTHVAIVTAVGGDGATVDVIECNWNYARAIGTRSGLPVEPDMVFIRPS